MNDNQNPQESRQPRNIFEQILFGVQITNENTVDVHRRLESVELKINAIYDALYPPTNTELNASGPEPVEQTVGGENQ